VVITDNNNPDFKLTLTVVQIKNQAVRISFETTRNVHIIRKELHPSRYLRSKNNARCTQNVAAGGVTNLRDNRVTSAQ